MNREMSTKTFERIRQCVSRISRRAFENGDMETYADADMLKALLLNLGNEIQVEDDPATRIAE